jgi:hypothetical protein
MKIPTLSVLSIVACVVHFSSMARASEIAPIWTDATWSGGVAAQGEMINPLSPDFLPVKDLEQGLVGRLDLRFTSPKPGVSQGAYSAVLLLFDGSRTLTFRGSGPAMAHGSLENQSWVAKVPRSPDVEARVTLRRPPVDPSARYLLGEVRLGSRIFPLFALPAVFHAGSNPLVENFATGSFTFFSRHPSLIVGTGVGTATITSGGDVWISATLGDLRKLSSKTRVLRTPQGRLLFVLARTLAGGGFFGGWWLFDAQQPESHWHGRAVCPGSPTPELDLLLAAYRAPAASETLVGWTRGTIDLDAPQADGANTRPASGDVAWTDPKRSKLAALRARAPAAIGTGEIDPEGRLNGANAFNVRLLGFSVTASSGLASGKMRYTFLPSPSSSKVHSSTFQGALNQKTGEIEGFVRPRYSGATAGFLRVSP